MREYLHVVPSQNVMHLYDNDKCVISYDVSIAKNGLGEQKNSFQTPRGWHYIRAKIGGNCPEAAVFRGRRWTKELFDNDLYNSNLDRDWIISRIMWLSGLEPGLNRLGNVDTMQRYVYIHGAPEQRMAKRPQSYGCVAMYQDDVVDLYERVPYGTRVFIGDELYNLK